MTDFVPAAFDPSLDDLKHITAEAVTTLSDATRANPAMVTITMDSSTLQSILTAARLHYYENPFVPNPVDQTSDYAEVSRQNNEESKHWHWLMEDAIEVLSGRISCAVIPERAQFDNKDQSVANNRKSRKLFEQMDKDEAAKAAAAGVVVEDKDTPEALKAWFKSIKAQPLTGKQMVGFLVGMRKEPGREVSWDVAAKLFATASAEASKAERAEQRVNAARAALGG
jgi:hypothetical protein